jgi:hypothetical protein
MPRASAKPSWRSSEAKETLRKDILEEKLVKPWMKPSEVFQTRPELYEPFKKNFSDNLRRLRKHLTDEQSRAGSDNAIIRHDLQIRPRLAMTPKKYPRWDMHAANTLLKLDFDAIEEGLVEEMAPMQWHQSRNEYKEFPLQVFRDHIHQEKRSRRARPYWMYQTNNN